MQYFGANQGFENPVSTVLWSELDSLFWEAVYFQNQMKGFIIVCGSISWYKTQYDVMPCSISGSDDDIKYVLDDSDDYY